jgi:hemolysin type calcium-binding protein/WD40 repeat protein
VRMHGRLRRALVVPAALVAGLGVLSSASGGAFSGDNGKIAYTCGTRICTINVDGTGGTTLSSLPANSSDPSWSDDGSQIAFLDAANGVSIANADGTGVGQLGAGSTSSSPTFSADGLRVAYAKQGDLWSILARGTGQELHLTTSAATDADPQYSPDGSELAFARNDGATGYDIWVVDLSNGTETQVTATAGDERNPTWSPTGFTIVYTSSSNGHLFAVPSTAVQSTTPTDLGVAGTQPAYSPDGTKIAFVAGGQLKYMVAQQNGAVTAIANTAGGTQPDWQPLTPAAPPVITSGPPANVSYPTINLAAGDASPVVGHVLFASVGSWNGAFPIAYTYQWKRCQADDPLNGPCVSIADATSSFYTPANADAGSRLRVEVTATNSAGSASQNSESTAVVIALAPKVTATPEISDDSPVVDTPLTLSAGTWSGSTPIAFTYSWRRCNPVGDPATCVPIPDATTATYTPVLADVGFSLRVWIVGANPAGSDTAVTNHTFPVVDKQHFSPSVAAAPLVAGTAVAGRQLTADIGAFKGDAPIKTSFVWERCDATGAACHTIAHATKVVYYPTRADIGFTVRLSVRATNAYGTMVTQSPATETIAGTPPHVRGRRIVGTAKGEYLAGGGHDDVIFGLGGNDTLLGGAGDDRIYGGTGNDVITPGAGADRVMGGPGSDTIYAADGERDVVNCGAGRDRAVVDPVDKTIGCEVVEGPPPSQQQPPGAR